MSEISRRSFLKWGACSSLFLLLSGYTCSYFFLQNKNNDQFDQECMFFIKKGEEEIQCYLCHHQCIIHDGQICLCKVRKASGGTLYNSVYARPAAVVVEPVEKEPQYHFLPGSNALCIGTPGCNFTCRNCHNWQLSQQSLTDLERYHAYSPRDIVDLAHKRQVPTISFTYNEPTVFYEYMLDISMLAKEEGLKTMLHTNGFMHPDPLDYLLPYLDTVTIDLKAFTEDFYGGICGGKLSPVLDTLRSITQAGIWLEIVNLVIPRLNDDFASIQKMCRWIRTQLGEHIPLHFSRFSPAYKLRGLPPTPLETLEKAYTIAKEEGLLFVTLANTPGHKYNSTFCPVCNRTLVERHHIMVKSINIENGKCRFCYTSIPGIWS